MVEIERAASDHSAFIVVMPDADAKHGEYVSAHRNYFSALREALKLQREFAPAVLTDKIGGVDARTP
jgi:hypothetical protein